MYLRLMSCLFLLIGLTVNAQTINLGGIVSNTTSHPIANAIVTLVGQGMKDTTGSDGKYLFTKSVASTLPAIVPQTEEISMNNGVLQFTLSNSSPMKIEVFNVKGNLLKKELLPNTVAGVYRFNIEKNLPATNVLVIKASIGKNEMSFRYMPMNSGKFTLNPSGAYSSAIGGGFAKMAAVVDTLKATAAGFQTKTVAITSYDNQQQNITLDSSNGMNPPGPSLGCGKTLGAINKSGTYTITSSGTNRTYIINIPTNYDKNKPYRLIFGMHCMGGSAARVASPDVGDDLSAFYHVKTQADKDNIPCIFVAPQGNSDGTWQGAPDHIFFSDMLNLFKDTLCIDTTRVFSVGFSFGAMFTYSLSLEFADKLRAIACYAPANYNMYQPTNKHLPLAYFQTTGTQDGTCPWINSDANKLGGKYCLLDHVQDNGCTVPSTIPLATSAHVTTEFSGCKDGYPARFCSFVGGHQCTATDPGSSTNWIAVETWNFLKRF